MSTSLKRLAVSCALLFCGLVGGTANADGPIPSPPVYRPTFSWELKEVSQLTSKRPFALVWNTGGIAGTVSVTFRYIDFARPERSQTYQVKSSDIVEGGRGTRVFSPEFNCYGQEFISVQALVYSPAAKSWQQKVTNLDCVRSPRPPGK